LLAGGLEPDNISVAIQTVHPHGVDVHTGVENADGSKSAAKLRSFCALARTELQLPARVIHRAPT
jgi:phosphoribosylanthranilate isomerase